MSGVEIQVRANTTKARTDLAKLQTSVKAIEGTVTGAQKAFVRMAAGITGIFATSALTKGLTEATDSITNMTNKLAVVSESSKDAQKALTNLRRVAADTRVPIENAVETFAKLSLSMQGSGRSSGELLKATKVIQQASIVSGATAQEASNAIRQLGQGLTGGVLRAEEYNSIIEGMPRLAKAIADGMGIPLSELRQAMLDGALTQTVIFDALTDQAINLQIEFDQMTATTAQLTTIMRDEFTRAKSALDGVFGVSTFARDNVRLLTSLFTFIADNAAIAAAAAGLRFSIMAIDIRYAFFTAKEAIESFFNIDLGDNRFTRSITTVQATLAGWGMQIVGIFADIYNLLFGNSYWWEMWDEGNNYLGHPRFHAAINSVASTLSSWKTKIVEIFETLSINVLYYWGQVKQVLKENVTENTPIGKTINSLKQSLADLNKQIMTNEKETPDGVQIVDSAFAIRLDRATEAIKNFGSAFRTNIRDLLFTTEVSTSAEGPIERLKTLPEVVSGLKNLSIGINIPPAVQAFFEALKEVGGDKITIVVETAGSIYEGGKSLAQGFMDTVTFDTAVIKASIGVAMAAGIAFGFKRLGKIAIGTITVGALVQEQAFQDQVEDIGRGIGKIIAKAFEPGGDVLGNIAKGLKDTLSAFRKGIAEGLSGVADISDTDRNQVRAWAGEEGLASITAPSFADEILAGVITAVATGLSAAIFAPKIVKALAKLSLGLATGIFKKGGGKGADFSKSFASRMGSAMSNGILEVRTNPKGWAAGSRILGKALSAAVIVGFKASFVAAFAAAVTIGVTSAMAKGAQLIKDRNTKVLKDRALDESVSERTRAIDLSTAMVSGVTVDLSQFTTVELKEIQKLLNQQITQETYQNDRAKGLEKIINALNPILNNLGSTLEKVNAQLRVNAGRASPHLAAGGSVKGQGTGTSDSIPAMLSNGEYVIQAKSVSKFGIPFMNAINSGRKPVFRQGGGPADSLFKSVGATSGNTFIDAESVIKAIEKAVKLGDLAAAKEIASRYGNIGELVDAINANTDLTEEQKATTTAVVTDVTKNAEAQTRSDQAKEIGNAFVNDVKLGFSQALKTGDFSDLGGFLLDSFTGKVVDGFVSGAVDSLFSEQAMGPALDSLFAGALSFGDKVGDTTVSAITSAAGPESKIFKEIGKIGKDLFKGITSIFSGGASGGSPLGSLFGEGGGFGSLLKTGLGFFGIPGFNQGGIVPTTPYSKAGVDSVPAMLTPGELIVPANKVKSYQDNTSKQQNVVNLSITGDVSRQTRQEIIKMLPTISAGVNATNKENNYKGR